MDIKRMHEMIETLTEVAKCEIDKGIENVDTKEMGEVADIIKDLSEAMYYRTITVAMEDSEYGVDYDWEGRKGYRGQPRDSKGRYMSRRRGYMPMMYDYDWDNMQMDRDMDREHGKMYYTEPMTMRNDNQTHSESRYDRARKGYEESKAMHKGNTAEDKQHKMKELENYLKTMAEDLTEAIEGATPEERTMVKQKVSTLLQKM